MPQCRIHGELPETSFSKRATGYIPPVCKQCERDSARENRKARYQDPTTRGLIRSQNKSWQQNNSGYLSDKFKKKYSSDEVFRNRILDRVSLYKTDPQAHRLKRERAATYFQQNKSKIYERIQAKQAKYPELKLRGVIRSRVWGALKQSKGGDSVLNHLPYSLQDLKHYIESKFESWMTWDNWGPASNQRQTWQIDHIIPQSMFPYESMGSDNFLLCWSLNNLRPLESKRNFTEGNRSDSFNGCETFSQFLSYVRNTGYVSGVIDPSYERLSLMNVDDTLPQPFDGLSYLDSLFPHRFNSRSGQNRSFIDFWNDDLEILRVVAYVVADGRIPTPKIISTNVKFNSSLPAHFYPSAASALVRKYASGGDVIDPFLGWGGRTLGALCGGAKSICGTDLQSESVDGCRRLVDDYAKIRLVDSEFTCQDFATYLQNTERRFDLLMTSPPFMATEDYGVKGHSDVRSWSEQIVQPLVRGALRVVKSGGHIAIHGQDRRNMPVLTTLLTAFTAAGMEKVAEYRYGKTAGQSVVVFLRTGKNISTYSV